ncbi:MAG: ABC transporter permease [Armatimonadota bacterium]|nr:ABC transporter permease [Armatimonadota bacterium]MDR7448464.1 ABC transporter permease [Armatimonadota bacterium]MDR7459354.1 ABC transporter permease [Armatimonadota bacterium]MDR7479450.1 ABC transporter permease [Armatimonadota bacterium]MDR7487492.1 ABC transporter permease [Armatimonadota bacterium]
MPAVRAMPVPRVEWRRLFAMRELGVLVALLALVAVFSLLQPAFLTLDTFGDILTQAAELGVAAVGVTFLMIAGEFDLSVGSNFAFTGVVLALLVTRAALPAAFAVLLALLVAATIGLLNGVVTLATRIPSFITTLGTMMLWRGLALAITGGWPISILTASTLLEVLGGKVIWSTLRISAVWLLVVTVAFWFLLGKTRYGNWVFATGGKREAARALGVPVRRVKLINFTLAGVLAGAAGFLQFGRMRSMSPVWGDALALEAIAAAVIGGTSLMGGSGTILGTVLGAVTMAAIRVGLVMVGAPSYWYTAFLGVVVVLAVILNVTFEELVRWRR